MNAFQELWWLQAKSDYDLYVSLREKGASQCHQLHYLQMATEKLGKAFFWSDGTAPKRTHAGFVQFMRQLGSVPSKDQRRVASTFGFSRFDDFQNWIFTILPLAYELQALAPALANDGPNPEYPWPQRAPIFSPVRFDFPLSSSLLNTGRGRNFLRMLGWAIAKFPVYS